LTNHSQFFLKKYPDQKEPHNETFVRHLFRCFTSGAGP